MSRGTDNSSNSSSGKVEMLFTWVFVACVVLALLLIVSLCMVIVCWRSKRRRRTATVTDVRKGANPVKERKRGRTNLRNSIKRVFVSDGPLYAVSNLSGSRYTDIRAGQNQQNSDSARSSPEIVADNQSHISRDNQRVVYERYLSPIESAPTQPESVTPIDRGDETYLQPIDELRASKRFLQRSRNDSPEPDDPETYLEPLHGIPVPDDIQPKAPSTKTSSKPVTSPKPTVKAKPK
ncbi:uncharacterized protein LOC114530630 [Dendronephthya gigantea]|uniref:uncharacterized protein LOC114530630 n=1 Tax=Dendronephthya gigantea TaxID=151771 RepID=UPI00106DCBCF|nr:uncharacterized protein LOC114530630 [Dendronephthya gigantea]